MTISTCKAFALALAVAHIAGCSQTNPDYCDENTPCASGRTCNLQSRSCEPAKDGAIPPSDGADSGTDADAASKKKANGAACAAPSECESNSCTDGVCCESACAGTCRTCNGTMAGTCELVGAGADPRGDCTGTDSVCEGSCDGQGSCTFPDDTTSCGATTCSSGSLETKACDGSGGCSSKTNLCNGFACDSAGTSCKTACSGNSDCNPPFTCVNNVCVAQLPNGSACGTNDNACASAHCVDGVCCGSASCSTCNRCNIAGSEGSCAAVPNGELCGATKCDANAVAVLTPTCGSGNCNDVSASCGTYKCNSSASPVACRAACNDINDCSAGSYCDASKACVPKKDNGMSCTANGECKTDACAKEGTATSGVCCDRACGGGANVCESCALSGKVGTCSFKSAGTVCGPGADVCTDNATTRSSATLRQQCSGTAATCGASGACPAGTKCNAAKTACATSCSAHSECWEGICDLWDIHNAQNKCASPADTCHVSPGGSGNGTFGSPFGIIQNCLAANKKYVRVSDGTYNESLSVKNKVALIAPQSPAEAMVTGSFTSNVIIQSPSASDALTVDGSKIAGSDKRALVYGMRFTSTSGSGSAIYVTQAARVDLLSVGAHDVAGTCIFSDASAALIVASSGTSRCGTGILKVGGSLDLRASYVFDHQTQGISVGNASLTMRSTIVGGNNVGVAISESTVDIDRVYVLQNNDRGIEIADSTAKVTNTVVASNGSWGIVVATVGGTAPGSSADFGNVTVAHNNGAAADVYCDPVSNVTGRFVNSIIWDDTGTGFSGCSFEYSTIKTDSSTPTGPGNNSLDPQFTFPSVLDYTLTSASPCVDTGSDTGGSIGTSVITATDVKGNNRKVKVGSTSSTIDRGAFERQTP